MLYDRVLGDYVRIYNRFIKKVSVMERIDIQKLKFGSFTKLVCIISTMFGITIGFLFFLFSLFGGSVYANLGNIEFTGVTAGVINIFLVPIIFAFFGFIIALLSYLPFNLYLKILKKVIIYGDLEIYQVSEISINRVIENKEVDENKSNEL